MALCIAERCWFGPGQSRVSVCHCVELGESFPFVFSSITSAVLHGARWLGKAAAPDKEDADITEKGLWRTRPEVQRTVCIHVMRALLTAVPLGSSFQGFRSLGRRRLEKNQTELTVPPQGSGGFVLGFPFLFCMQRDLRRGSHFSVLQGEGSPRGHDRSAFPCGGPSTETAAGWSSTDDGKGVQWGAFSEGRLLRACAG